MKHFRPWERIKILLRFIRTLERADQDSAAPNLAETEELRASVSEKSIELQKSRPSY